MFLLNSIFMSKHYALCSLFYKRTALVLVYGLLQMGTLNAQAQGNICQDLFSKREALTSVSSNVFKDFEDRWGIPIKETKNSIKSDVLVQVKPGEKKDIQAITGIFFSEDILKRPEDMQKILEKLGSQFLIITKLKSLNVEVDFSFQGTSLDLVIKKVHGRRESNSPLEWIRQRMDRWGLKFRFVSEDIEVRLKDCLGFSEKDMVFLPSDMLFKDGVYFLTRDDAHTLAHEMTHAINFVQSNINGYVGPLISFELWNPAMVSLPIQYRSFRSDEVEAWYVGAQILDRPEERVKMQVAANQFLVQLPWLEFLYDKLEKYEMLPSYQEGNNFSYAPIEPGIPGMNFVMPLPKKFDSMVELKEYVLFNIKKRIEELKKFQASH